MKMSFIVNYVGAKVPFSVYFPNEIEVENARFLQFKMLAALTKDVLDVPFQYKVELVGKALCELVAEQRFEEEYELLANNRYYDYQYDPYWGTYSRSRFMIVDEEGEPFVKGNFRDSTTTRDLVNAGIGKYQRLVDMTPKQLDLWNRAKISSRIEIRNGTASGMSREQLVRRNY